MASLGDALNGMQSAPTQYFGAAQYRHSGMPVAPAAVAPTASPFGAAQYKNLAAPAAVGVSDYKNLSPAAAQPPQASPFGAAQYKHLLAPLDPTAQPFGALSGDPFDPTHTQLLQHLQGQATVMPLAGHIRGLAPAGVANSTPGLGNIALEPAALAKIALQPTDTAPAPVALANIVRHGALGLGPTGELATPGIAATPDNSIFGANADFAQALSASVTGAVSNANAQAAQVAKDNQNAIDSQASTMVAGGGDFGGVGRQFSAAQGNAEAVNQQHAALAAAQAGEQGMQTLAGGLQQHAAQLSAQTGQALDQSAQEIGDAVSNLVQEAQQGIAYMSQDKLNQLLALQKQVQYLNDGIKNNAIGDTEKHTIIQGIIGALEVGGGIALVATGAGAPVGGALIATGAGTISSAASKGG
jgi:hypothetical protein